jgi:hypothetical protein
MIGVMMNDMRHYVINLLVLGVGLPLYFSMTHGQMDSTVVYLMVGYLYFLTLMAMFAAELSESRYRGYEVLSALPVRGRSIVAGKFMLIVMAAVAYAALVWFYFAQIGADPGSVAVARRWLLLNASFSILVAGASYLGSFRFGFDRWVWAHIFLVTIFIVAPIALNESAERGLLTGRTHLARFITRVDPTAICAVALLIFAALWYATSLVKERRDV